MWRYSFEALKWKVQMASEELLNRDYGFYESAILAVGVAFGGNTSSSAPAPPTSATTAAELQAELNGLFGG